MMASVAPLTWAEEAGPAEDLAAAALSLARHFAAGATMWCISVPWPAHGRHVAVEFVHPVIVGKRALPAVHVASDDVAGSLRLLARPGDVLLAVSTAEDAPTIDLLRRAEAWGLARLWLGAGRAGSRPPAGLAEHVVWLEGVDAGWAARSGDLVLLYHLLWELTHVVFEHPGLLTPEPVETTEVCITCSDRGEVAELTRVDHVGRAQAVVAGRPETIDVSLVDQAAPGDLVLVHAGVAVTALGDTRP
jgi:hypothetical protein